MKKILLLMALALFGEGYSQNLWSPAEEVRLAGKEKVYAVSVPDTYQLFNLNLPQLKAQLAAAPKRENYTGPSEVIVAFPDASGKVQNYRVYEAAVLHPELAAKYPDINAYVGKGIDNPAVTIRFSLSLFGFKGMLFTPEGTEFIDPYTKDLASYIVYKKSSLTTTTQHFNCQVPEKSLKTTDAVNETSSALFTDGTLRTYRLAMACTVEYAAYHINLAGLNNGTTAQKKAAVLSAMNDCMTRVDGVYERDLAVTMQIVPNNESIIFVTTDNLNNNDAEVLIDQAPTVINANIGNANYDIGHCVSTGAGGLAAAGVCQSSYKAEGVTGGPDPIGDPFYIDYVAHEMGHQFGANHTFNGNGGSCGGGNRWAPTAVEPGSGSTIMAYAGICSSNVQDNSDDYFHAVSLDEIMDYINDYGSCAVTSSGSNAEPVIQNLTSYAIPQGTAFVLKGNATDANGDALTYCWEQTDTGTAANNPSPTATTGPNYRSLDPSLSPNRYMPTLQNVLGGNLEPAWEKTPTVGRTLGFALTVRDNAVPYGQTARKNMTVTVKAAAGPFAVTSQNTTGISYQGASQQTVTWDVAGTTANGINTANVNILLSTDAGQNFSTVLLSGTANDGSEVVTLPNVNAASCRIIVEAVDNIYYAVNSKAFAIVQNTAGVNEYGLQDFVLYPNPGNGNFTVKFTPDNTSNVGIIVTDMRGRQIFAREYKNTGLFAENINLSGIQSGIYMVTVQSGADKGVQKIIVN